MGTGRRDSWGARGSLSGGRVRTALCVALVSALLASLAAPGVAGATTTPRKRWYPDVSASQLSAAGVSRSAVMRVAQAMPSQSTRFRPTDRVTRAEMVSFMVVALDITPLRPLKPTFKDVPRAHPLYGFVEAAVRARIIVRPADGLFHPSTSMTRQAATSMVMRYLVKRHGRTMSDVMPDDAVAFQLGMFADGGSVAPAYRRPVALAIARSAVESTMYKGRYYLRPTAALTRLEAVGLVTSQRKPGVSTLYGSEGHRHPIASILMELGDGIVHGLTTFGLDSAKDAMFGDKEWDEVNAQLTDIQDGISDIETGISDIEAQLAALSAEYEEQSAEIKAMVAGSQAQVAMDDIDSWYSAAGVDNYAYYTSMERRFSRDMTKTAEGLAAYQADVLAPKNHLMTDLLNISSAIVPTGASESGVLTQWTTALCVGDLSDEELQDSYDSLEAYYCALVSHQMEAVQILVDANNAQEGGSPLEGFTNCYEANRFLEDTWHPMLRAQNENFFKNACRMAIRNARNRNDFQHSTDLMGDPEVASIIKQADFLCSSLEEQCVTFEHGTGEGDPNHAYGLHAVSIHPTGLATSTVDITAQTEIPVLDTYVTRYFVPVAAVATTNTTAPTGAKTLVFNGGQTTWTCDMVDTYVIRRMQFSPGVLDHPGNQFSFSGLPGMESVTLARVDTGNEPTSGTGPDTRLYGCAVVAYQYDGRPAPLDRFALTKTTTESFVGGYPVIAPGSASAYLNMRYSNGWKMGWDLRTESTPFTWIGPDGTAVGWTLYADEAEASGSPLVHNWYSYPWGDSWSWNCGLGVSDGAGAVRYSYSPSAGGAVAGKATPITSDLTQSAATMAVKMSTGQDYATYLTNYGAWKCTLPTVTDYALSIGNTVKVDHARITIKE